MGSTVLYFFFFPVTFLLTAVFNLCVVSYDRLTAIVLPMEKRITMRSAKMTMIFTWTVGLTVSIPFAIYRNYKVSLESFFDSTEIEVNMVSMSTLFPHRCCLFVCLLFFGVANKMQQRNANGKISWKNIVLRM